MYKVHVWSDTNIRRSWETFLFSRPYFRVKKNKKDNDVR